MTTRFVLLALLFAFITACQTAPAQPDEPATEEPAVEEDRALDAAENDQAFADAMQALFTITIEQEKLDCQCRFEMIGEAGAEPCEAYDEELRTLECVTDIMRSGVLADIDLREETVCINAGIETAQQCLAALPDAQCDEEEMEQRGNCIFALAGHVGGCVDDEPEWSDRVNELAEEQCL